MSITFWDIMIYTDIVLFIIVAVTVIYLGFFAIASLFNKNHESPRSKKQNRIVVLIPSYHQDAVIEQAVISILSQAYPQRMFDITVISDHQEEMLNTPSLSSRLTLRRVLKRNPCNTPFLICQSLKFTILRLFLMLIILWNRIFWRKSTMLLKLLPPRLSRCTVYPETGILLQHF